MKSKNNNDSKTFTKKWFYIAVGCGVVFAVVTTLIAIFRDTKEKETKSIDEPKFIQTQDLKRDVEKYEENRQNQLEKERNYNKIDSKDENEETKEQTQEENKKNKKYKKPVEGRILQEYSGEKLVKSPVLNDWRTHDGIDLKAKQNTPVKAIADGVVEDITNDADIFGLCITIDHGNNIKSVYKGLSDQLQVKLNQKVKEQDTIGLVGNTNKIESNLDNHLHFEVLEDDETVDPKKYIELN